MPGANRTPAPVAVVSGHIDHNQEDGNKDMLNDFYRILTMVF
jgi:hypothetical protein